VEAAPAMTAMKTSEEEKQKTAVLNNTVVQCSKQ